MINILVVIQNYSFNSSKDVILAIGIFFYKNIQYKSKFESH